jgi:L-lactate permease
MVTYTVTVVSFIVALIISAVTIYLITKLFGEKEGLGTALIAAFVGTILYTIVYYFLGQGLVAAVIGGIFWLIALRHLYKIGWIKSLAIAVVIWIVTSIVGLFLPTLVGPV